MKEKGGFACVYRDVFVFTVFLQVSAILRGKREESGSSLIVLVSFIVQETDQQTRKIFVASSWKHYT